MRLSFPVCQSLPSLGATTTTAASGGNREALLGAAASKTQAKRCGCWVPQPGQWHAEGVTERLSPKFGMNVILPLRPYFR